MINEGALFAARNNQRQVTMQNLDKARDKMLMGAEKRTMVMTREELLMTAYHEAGHAVMALALRRSIERVSIEPNQLRLGQVKVAQGFRGPLKDAVEMRRLAREHNVPCWSSSSLRYSPDQPAKDLAKVGQVTSVYSFGPCEYEPHHPDLFWYGVHGCESLFTVMGTGCLSAQRTTNAAGGIVVTGRWPDGRIGRFEENPKGYDGLAHGTKGELTVGAYDGYAPLVAEVPDAG